MASTPPMNLRSRWREWAIPSALLLSALVLLPGASLGPGQVLSLVVSRLCMNGLLVLALLPPLQAGMGFNFATGLGVLSAQLGFFLAVVLGLGGLPGTAVAGLAGLLLAAGAGWLLGWLLCRTPGVEALLTFFLKVLLQAGATWLLVRSLTALLPASARAAVEKYGGSNLDLSPFLHTIDLEVHAGPVTLPLGTLSLILLAGIFLAWRQRNRTSQTEVPSDGAKRRAFALSTVLAALSHILFLQGVSRINPGIIVSAPLFSIIPILVAGGATCFQGKVRHAFVGLVSMGLFMILFEDACMVRFALPSLYITWNMLVPNGLLLLAFLPKPAPGPA